MHFEGDSPLSGLKRLSLGVVSLIFKTLSWANLKLKALHPHSFPDTFIVSVDNLSFGGTGKTTLVLAIGEFLHQQGIPFAIVMRGYRSKMEKENRSVKVEPHHSAHEVGDEAMVFKQRFPHNDVYVGRNRIDSIDQAIANGNKMILLDDGFQSTHIRKNMKIMLVNPQHPYYYLRNFKRLMKEEDIILRYHPNHVTQTDSPVEDAKPCFNDSYCGSYWFELSGFRNTEGQWVNLESVPVVGFSALGDNRRFREDLEHASQVEVADFKGFSDHHRFTPEELDRLDQLRKNKQAQYLVCTEKDFMKILPLKLHRIPFLYAQNSIKFNFNLMSRLLDHAKKENYV